MTPNFVAALFISLGIAPISPADRFTIEWDGCILEIIVHRIAGSVERLVMIQTTLSDTFEFLEPFDPKAMSTEKRIDLFHFLKDLGRTQKDLARLFQVSESAVSRVFKEGS